MSDPKQVRADGEGKEAPAPPPPPRTLPNVSVQHDWEVDVHAPDKAYPFWLAIRPFGADRSYHGKCKVHPDGILEGTDGYTVKQVHHNTLAVQHEAFEGSTFHVTCPKAKEKVPFHGKPLCVDVSPGGDLVVCSGTNGGLAVLNAGDLKPMRHLKGHKGDVHKCRFFPSGEVVLTAGADWRVRIWSAVDGSNPVSLTHGASVRDIAIIDRGRNVLSGAMDGKVRLWDCGTGTCLHAFRMEEGNPTCLALVNCPEMAAQDVQREIHEREVGTEGRIVAAGTLRHIRLLDLRAQQPVTAVAVPKLSTLSTFDDVHIVSGHENGHISLWDCRKFSAPLSTTVRWEVPINSLVRAPASMARRGVLAGNADGSCFSVDLDSLNMHDLSGSDLDPITSVAATPRVALTAASDGVLRAYDVRHPQ